MPPTSEPGRSVSSRLLQVLFAFRPGHTRLTLAALARRTGLPQATVRRLAIELVAGGALDRARDGTLTVGTRLWQLGTLAPLTEPLRNVALPFMEDLSTALQQHVQLAVLEGYEAVIVERLSTPNAVGLPPRWAAGCRFTARPWAKYCSPTATTRCSTPWRSAGSTGSVRRRSPIR